MKNVQTVLQETLLGLYTPEEVEWFTAEVEKLLRRSAEKKAPPQMLSESDTCFVCYANSIVDSSSNESPVQVLEQTFRKFALAETYPIVHLLPFFPWDTDRGFSVCDYRQVAAENGSWEDIESFSRAARLMFDFVANHASVENPLVQSALLERHFSSDDPRYAAVANYKDFVIAYSEDDAPSPEELAKLARPRAAPVLTPYVVVENGDGSAEALLGDASDAAVAGRAVLGSGLVWTTFSRGKDDKGAETTRQVDLNFKNPKVLLETLNILLFYVSKGARLIRLDAIGYLWKKIGSVSLHEKETHQLLVCLKALMEQLAPHVLTVAEVNEPQEKVFGYLGSPGREESDIVYQFTHFPLAIHAVLTETPGYYSQWLETLSEIGGRQFITVLGSHDGVGMKPARGILPEEDIEALLSILVEQHGGLPNYAVLPGGKKIVYEVCATPWDLINNPQADESQELQLARFRAVVCLGLQVRGLPAFYINGAFGCRNYQPVDGLDENRTVNREIFSAPTLWDQLTDGATLQARVHQMLKELLSLRSAQPAFNPNAPALVPLTLGEYPVVASILPALQAERELVSLINVSASVQSVPFSFTEYLGTATAKDVLSGEEVDSTTPLELTPYQACWFTRR